MIYQTINFIYHIIIQHKLFQVKLFLFLRKNENILMTKITEFTVYAYIHIYTHTYIDTYIDTYIYTYISTYAHVHLHYITYVQVNDFHTYV